MCVRPLRACLVGPSQAPPATLAAGTLSEISLAWIHGRPILGLGGPRRLDR